MGRVYIMQDSGKNTACALLHTVHMKAYVQCYQEQFITGLNFAVFLAAVVCLFSKVGMGSLNRLFTGAIKLPNP